MYDEALREALYEHIWRTGRGGHGREFHERQVRENDSSHSMAVIASGGRKDPVNRAMVGILMDKSSMEAMTSREDFAIGSWVVMRRNKTKVGFVKWKADDEVRVEWLKGGSSTVKRRSVKVIATMRGIDNAIFDHIGPSEPTPLSMLDLQP